MKKIDEFWYPDTEERLHRGHARYSDIEEFILPHVRQRRTCIHAGGGAGTWTREYTKYFEYVYTAEPNPELRECIHANSYEGNYALLEGGFWNRAAYGRLVEYQPDNMGAWYIQEDPTGSIPLFTIDSLDAEEVDLIQLDVEGAEIECLQGAKETILRDRPVVVLEVKETTQKFYGRSVDDLRKAIHGLKYRQEAKFGRDELWVPQES